jgi:hypothetical protein
MPLFGSNGRSKSEHVNVEYWGYGGLEGVFGSAGEGVIPDPTTYTGGSGMFQLNLVQMRSIR